MRWYVAGPMRGIKYYNFPAFDKAADELRDAGYEVFNPADSDRETGFDPFLMPDDHDWSKFPEGMNFEAVIARDLDELQKCDGIYMLEGWEKSEAGAHAEHAVAKWKQLEIVYEAEAPDRKDTNPKDAIGSRKTPLSNVPCPVLMELGLAMLEGACKYGRHNYRIAGVRANVYYDAALRHLMAWWEGEDVDPDSGLPHLVKAMACIVVIRDAAIQGKLHDDRPPRSAAFVPSLNSQAAQLIDRFPNPVPAYTQKGVDRGDY